MCIYLHVLYIHFYVVCNIDMCVCVSLLSIVLGMHLLSIVLGTGALHGDCYICV